jgi:preprotein translocase subunit YajC
VSTLLIYVVVVGAVMMFMMSRGRRKQQTQQAMLRNAVEVGVEARTIGGLIGEVVEVTDDHVVLETTPGVRLKFVKTAIAGVVPPTVEDQDIAGELGLDESDETEHTDGEDDTGGTDETELTGETEPADEASADESDVTASQDAVVAEAEKVAAAAAESSGSTKK